MKRVVVPLLLLAACGGTPAPDRSAAAETTTAPEVIDLTQPTVPPGLDVEQLRASLLALDLPERTREGVRAADGLELALQVETLCDLLARSESQFGYLVATQLPGFDTIDQGVSYPRVVVEVGCPDLAPRLPAAIDAVKVGLDLLAPSLGAGAAERIRAEVAAADLSALLQPLEDGVRLQAWASCAPSAETLLTAARLQTEPDLVAAKLELFGIIAKEVCPERVPVVEEAIALLAGEGG